jgi:hypothetical protein
MNVIVITFGATEVQIPCIIAAATLTYEPVVLTRRPSDALAIQRIVGSRNVNNQTLCHVVRVLQ